MKKVFAVLFVAASIVLTSCGGGAKEVSNADSTKVADTVTAAPADTTQPVADTTTVAPADSVKK